MITLTAIHFFTSLHGLEPHAKLQAFHGLVSFVNDSINVKEESLQNEIKTIFTQEPLEHYNHLDHIDSGIFNLTNTKINITISSKLIRLYYIGPNPVKGWNDSKNNHFRQQQELHITNQKEQSPFDLAIINKTLYGTTTWVDHYLKNQAEFYTNGAFSKSLTNDDQSNHSFIKVENNLLSRRRFFKSLKK